jgi:hypothetical protein
LPPSLAPPLPLALSPPPPLPLSLSPSPALPPPPSPRTMRETGACLDVALALGYVESVDAVLLKRLDEVRAVLVKVVR